jgi:two-component system response regulator DesR
MATMTTRVPLLEKVKSIRDGDVIRILLVERMSLLRGALAAVLSAEDDLDVPAAIANMNELVPVARAVRPDVTVIDIELLTGGGFSLAQELNEVLPDCATLVLADADSPNALRTTFDTHVRGFASKDASPCRLADCIRQVAKGVRMIDPMLAVAALRAPRNPLTTREREVLGIMALGLPSSEIAVRLHLSTGTVCNYISTIIRKTRSRNRLEAVRMAEEAGWL